MRQDTVRRSGAGSAQRRVEGEIHGRHRPCGRQWRLEGFEGTGLGQIGEDLSQVMRGLKPTGLGGLDHGVQVGGGLSIGHGVMKNPSLPVMRRVA